MNWLMAFLHHLAAFTLVSTLVYERILMHKPLTLERAQSLMKTDQLYGAAAVALFIIGGLRVFYFEKGADYYFQSAPFIAKLVLFAFVGLLSIYPTKTFFSWRKNVVQKQLPVMTDKQQKRLQIVLNIQLLGVVGILLGAAMAAKGIGFVS